MSENDTRPISGLCECSYPGCSCGGQCLEEGIAVLYRVDMEDNIGVRFCIKCAEDAHESGLYTDRLEDSMDEFLAAEFCTDGWDDDTFDWNDDL